MSKFRRTLPERPDLEQQKKLAKELLRSFRDGDPEAIARVRAELPDKTKIALADAQFVIAREYGFPSWAALKEAIAEKRERDLAPVDRFKRAVLARDARALRRVLEESAEAGAAIDDTLFGFGATALLAAGNDLATVETLLEFGADANRKSDWWAGGFHPLHGARGAVADRLLKAGSIPDACGLANLDRADLLAAMLQAEPGRVHERGGDGKTPLHFARSRAVVDLLLAAGADIDARDVDHRSTAAEWMLGDEPGERRLELSRYLVERGANADIFLCAALGLAEMARRMLQTDRSLLQLRTSQGAYAEKPPSSYHIYQWTIGPNNSPLQVAAKFGQTETQRVMQSFATPEQLLMLACNRGDAAAARAIVSAHPGIVERLGPDDRRALTDEAWSSNERAVELMLDLGFDPSVPSVTNATGGTALHCAAWEGSAPCVSAILRYDRGRALINVREATYSGTPLSWCCHGSIHCGNPRADHAEVARQLIAAGATLEPEMADWDCEESVQAVIESALRQP